MNTQVKNSLSFMIMIYITYNYTVISNNNNVQTENLITIFTSEEADS